MEEVLTVAGAGLPAARALAATAGGGGAVRIIEIIADPLPSASEDSDDNTVANAIAEQKAQVLYTADAEVINASRAIFGSMIDMLDTQSVPPQINVP